ncbi:MAG: hypothetical protein RXR16_03525 [Thermocladium sp.]
MQETPNIPVEEYVMNLLTTHAGLNGVILNALPVNAFQYPMQVGLYRIPNYMLPSMMAALQRYNLKCFVGHPSTAQLINSMLGIQCMRGQWTYTDEAFAVILTLAMRPAQSGADIPVTLNDLLVTFATFRPGLDDPVLNAL